MKIEDQKLISKVAKVMSHANENIEHDVGFPKMINIDACLGLDGIVGQHHDEYYVCLAGSNEWKDWKVNFQLLGNKKGYHSGFAKSFLDGKEQILKGLFPNLDLEREDLDECLRNIGKQFTESNTYLNIAGFSNGAAVAVIVAIFFASRGFKVNCVTWGQPKALTKRQIEETDKIDRYYRICHPFDPVTYVPLLLKHGGQQVFKFWFGWGHDLEKLLKCSIVD